MFEEDIVLSILYIIEQEQLPEFRDSGEVQSVNRRVGIPDLTLIPHDTPRNYSDPAAHYMPRRAQVISKS